MTGLYFGETVRLKSHSATTKAGKSTLKIELETTDHFDLASILRQLDSIDQAQRDAAKPRKKLAPAEEKPKQLALPAPVRQIRDMREEQP
ncbi:hypothetical protein [Shinella kummerowiae]|uniref:hypothetical protein n=1 Tax=Shinella kummerowiae TaxID=417745 RepID=UPI0021B5F866|nr:hypothetical protein [Shinella kummerowiae]MCT7667637.1 hypothetical protein [Shinella kummerowiae]